MRLIEKFGMNLKEQRKILGMRQGPFAKFIGISRQQLQRIETGKSGVPISTVELIAEKLNIEPFELFI